MQIDEELIQGIPVLRTAGELKAQDHQDLEEKLEAMLAKENYVFVLDLAQVSFVSAECFHVFMSIQNILKTKNGKMVIAGINKEVKQLFKDSGFRSYFQMLPTVENAVEALI